MTAKLHINISQGVLDIEGDPELVREIYADFKDQLLAGGTERIQPPEKLEEHDKTPEALKSRIRTRRKTSSRKRAKSDEAGSDISADAPNLDRELDTSKLALFYGKYKPTNHPEKVLIFLMFLSEELGIESPNTDQVYTCYMKANERPPKVFAQAFRDASGRKFGYIDYKPPTDIRITTAGRSHFSFGLKKSGE